MDNTTQLFGGQTISNTTNHPLFASTIDPLCYGVDDYFLVPRFWLAVVFGISISIVSIIFNTFIFIVFVTSKQHRVTYMVPMLTISHIAITASTYLITFAAIERYSITVNNGAVKFLQNNRKIMALIAVMAGVISKGTILEEVTVMTDPDCIGTINEWSVKPSDLVKRANIVKIHNTF
uniref:G_PROTEIN_RECEP_F1_2 domain-containing protein n=1 Tax=Heterorhabditis bacteriophora TaxID=37862 RepID=A0A1I7WQM9_HETBA